MTSASAMLVDHVKASSYYKIAVIGSGNWGTAIAKRIGQNVQGMPTEFKSQVDLWVFDEEFRGRKLTDIINTDHQNRKYLPGVELPKNVVANSSLESAVKDAEILIFAIPSQFVEKICKLLVGKGIALDYEFNFNLISKLITYITEVPCHVLVGPNTISDLCNTSDATPADGHFTEATIGSKNLDQGRILRKLLSRDYLKIVCVEDTDTVEVCSYLRTIVACAAGIIDGLRLSDNVKGTVVRLGFLEMVRFTKHFFPLSRGGTFLESCGIGDLLTNCYSGQVRKLAELMVTSGKCITELECELMKGHRFLGAQTAEQVHLILQKHELQARFPVFEAVHQVFANKLNVTEFLNHCVQDHPEYDKNI